MYKEMMNQGTNRHFGNMLNEYRDPQLMGTSMPQQPMKPMAPQMPMKDKMAMQPQQGVYSRMLGRM